MKSLFALLRRDRANLAAALPWPAIFAAAPVRPVDPPPLATAGAVCVPAPASDYYAITLVPTRTIPGLQRASGTAEVSPPPSPFGVSVSADGSYAYDLDIHLEGLRWPIAGTYVAWIAPPDLSSIERVGEFDDTMRLNGRVSFNKFLVIVTLEPSADGMAERWQGPIVMRGMSRSGFMHTMIGHGPLRREPCANYGFR